MGYFILFFMFLTVANAQIPGDTCVSVNPNGDLLCTSATNPNAQYTVDSTATATAKAQAQAILNANQPNPQIQQLIQQDEQNIAIKDLQNQGLLTSQQASSVAIPLKPVSSQQAPS